MRTSLILSKYIAKQYLGWLLGVTSILSLLLVLVNYIELLRRAQNKPHVTLGKISTLVILQLPDLIEQIFPFCILFATLLTFWNLNRHAEMVVIRSCGQSIWKLLLPVVVIVMGYSTLSLTIINPLSATFLNKYEQLNTRFFQGEKSSLTISNTGLWFKQHYPHEYAIVHIEKIGTEATILENVTIYTFNHQHQFLNRVDGKKAYVRSQGFELQDVIESGPNTMDRKMETYFWHTDLTLSKIEESFASPGTISFWELPKFIELIEKAGFSANEHLLYWYSLLLKPLFLISMILLGGFYGARSFHRHQSGVWFVMIGLVIAFGMFLLQKVFYGLGKSLTIPAIMAVCAPLALSVLLGLSLLLHYEDK